MQSSEDSGERQGRKLAGGGGVERLSSCEESLRHYMSFRVAKGVLLYLLMRENTEAIIH